MLRYRKWIRMALCTRDRAWSTRVVLLFFCVACIAATSRILSAGWISKNIKIQLVWLIVTWSETVSGKTKWVTQQTLQMSAMSYSGTCPADIPRPPFGHTMSWVGFLSVRWRKTTPPGVWQGSSILSVLNGIWKETLAGSTFEEVHKEISSPYSVKRVVDSAWQIEAI